MYPVVPTKRTSGNFCIRLSNGLEVSKHTESNVLIRKTTINKKWDPQISFIRSGLPSMGLLNVPAWDYQAYPHKTWFCPLSMEISHCTVLFYLIQLFDKQYFTTSTINWCRFWRTLLCNHKFCMGALLMGYFFNTSSFIALSFTGAYNQKLWV